MTPNKYLSVTQMNQTGHTANGIIQKIQKATWNKSSLDIFEFVQIYLDVLVNKVLILFKEDIHKNEESVYRAKITMPKGRIQLSINQDLTDNNMINIYGMKFQSKGTVKTMFLFLKKMKALFATDYRHEHY
jgi:hypothetical protein